MDLTLFERAQEKFAVKHMQPPWNVCSVGRGEDEEGNLVITYTVLDPLPEGVEVDKECDGFKTRLLGIGKPRQMRRPRAASC